MAPNIDMLSMLPDPLLFIIISFLPFKEAANTSVLSQRWRHIWRSTTSLEFNERFFANNQRGVFTEFVQHWMATYQEPRIDKFLLTFSQPRESNVVLENCIGFALARNVKVLGLDFSDPTWDEAGLDTHAAQFDLPLCVYNHQVLESLTLFSCNFNVLGFENFGLLKHISLGWIELPRSSLNALLVKCVLLESLSLKNCWNMEVLDVCGRDLKLKTLVVDKCLFHYEDFTIWAPNLRYLKYSGPVSTFDVERTRGLEEVELDFGDESEFNKIMADIVYQLLYELYPSSSLTVCTYMLQAIPMGEEPSGLNPHLSVKHLTLKTSMHNHEINGINFFLGNCPRLETLTVELGPVGRIFNEYVTPAQLKLEELWMLDGTVDKCVTQTLRVVVVKGFKGSPNEVWLVVYLLIFGRLLERFDLITSKEEGNHYGSPEIYKLRAQSLLHGTRRASPNLKITVL